MQQQQEIPEEVIFHHVLIRLPIKSLLVLYSKCVNKFWHNWITSPIFLKLHLSSSSSTLALTEDDHFAIAIGGREGKLLSMPLQWTTNHINYNHLDHPVEIHHPFPPGCRHNSAEVYGSCNGLLLLKINAMPPDDHLHGMLSSHSLCISNPCTKDYKTLPKYPSNYHIKFPQALWFGYDSATNHFKVVVVRSCNSDRGKIYTTKTTTWREILHQFPQHIYYCYRNMHFANGAVHWIATAHHGTYSFVYFDIGSEE
ncbi:hypothetical protein Sjap_003603 [Stephania japonica]|uniref:F-box associated beta-propeller type 3 domain-containing protein n=1 Tax=Stephania japonica TaxID=461633 RepID=A0AAP0KQN5_9MAGN